MKPNLPPFALLALFSIAPLMVVAQPGAKPLKLASPDQTPEGLNTSDWQGIRAAYEAGRHAFQPVEGGWQAHNPGQQWLTTFDQRGFIAEPQGGGWTWGLELQSYGFGTQQQAISGAPTVKAEGQRLSYQWDGRVEEWFVNDQRGLEHGFTVASRPEQAGSGSLSFLMGTRGSLQAKLTEDALGVLFQDSKGSTVLNYSGLKVWDADGKILPSRFEAAGTKGVRLLVDEHGARYPLTIDPLAQQAYLKASNPEADDQFGLSVAVDGDTVVIGAPGEDSNATVVNGNQADNSAASAGAAYVFVRSGTTWTQQAYLKASNTDAGDGFGWSVTVSGDTVVVGAPGEDSKRASLGGTQADNTAPGAGAAYVFKFAGGTWTQQAFLKANNAFEGQFGHSVSLSGDTVLIGSPFEDTDVTGVWHGNAVLDLVPYPQVNDGNGAGYVFTRSGSVWTQQAMLKASILYATFHVG